MVMRWCNDVLFTKNLRYAKSAASVNLGIVIFFVLVWFFLGGRFVLIYFINVRETTTGTRFERLHGSSGFPSFCSHECRIC